MLKQLVLAPIRAAGYELISKAELARRRSEKSGMEERVRALESALGYLRPASAAQSIPLEIKPLSEIPVPSVDLTRIGNPIPEILKTREFGETTRFFVDNPAASRSLISPDAQALLFAVIRNQRPEHVFEIGTFRAGTAEAIARALHANGAGMLHTVDPYGAEHVPTILAQWPQDLRARVRFHPFSSMDFYTIMEREKISPGLVLVDGKHDYEFAAFDIWCAARHMKPGGFIFIDNVAQAGPFFAAADFLVAHPGWQECGNSRGKYDRTKAYDRHRTDIVNTDLIVLRAPSAFVVDARAVSSGEMPWYSNIVNGLKIRVARAGTGGALHVQCLLRGISPTQQVEVIGEAAAELHDPPQEFTLKFNPPLQLIGDFAGHFARISVEPWFIWLGKGSLELAEIPRVY